MIPKHRVPSHPGQILAEEFLLPLDIPQSKLADHLGIPVQRVSELVRGRRRVTPDTAWLLAGAFKTTPDFWMNLQMQHDLAKSRPERLVPHLRMGTRRAKGVARKVTTAREQRRIAR